MSSAETTSGSDKKRKSGNGRNGKHLLLEAEPVAFSSENIVVAVESPTPKKPLLMAEARYVEYLEDRLQKLEWKIQHMELESTTERDRSLIRRLQHYMIRIQNAPFDDKARKLLEQIRKEELEYVKC